MVTSWRFTSRPNGCIELAARQRCQWAPSALRALAVAHALRLGITHQFFVLQLAIPPCALPVSPLSFAFSLVLPLGSRPGRHLAHRRPCV